jgi:5'-3' exoribonuclease 1
MGIPSYFNYIIKNHSNILKKINSLGKVHNLYLDSNSIIYDVIRTMNSNGEYEPEKKEDYENEIYENVVNKIEYYINLIKPENNVFIAFDGVAPMAKLEQQRTRRLKSLFINKVMKDIKSKYSGLDDNININKKQWNQTAITPGTLFMKNLDDYIKSYFLSYTNTNQNTNTNGNLSQNSKSIEEQRHIPRNIIISGCEDVGEGEHKIFEYIRENKEYHMKTKTLIYGLDADLIMLCICHLNYVNSLYLFRETPDFGSVIDDEYKEELYCSLNIRLLSSLILQTMNKGKHFHISVQRYKIFDYILISFMLGNDFMPHFPALNLRTNGMDILLETYGNIVKETEYLCNGKEINWKVFYKFIKELAINEHNYILNEYRIMNKWKRIPTREDTEEDMIKKFNMLPIMNREIEDYIEPKSPKWQQRYYIALFKEELDREKINIRNHKQKYNFIKNICYNYLEGLEWTLKYYTEGCINYRWKYDYNYPPLLSDLVNFIPEYDMCLVERNMDVISPITQLCYVLPEESYDLIPDQKLVNKLIQLKKQNIINETDANKENTDITDTEFIWAYCKYFWESHIIFKDEITIDDIEKLQDESPR